MITGRLGWISAASALALLVGCGGDGGNSAGNNGNGVNNGVNNGNNGVNNGVNNGNNGNNGADCTPSKAVYNSVASGLIEEHCGKCHGETPQFGAPNTLVGDYDALLVGEVRSRLVDRMAVRAANKTMPPVGNLVPHTDLDTLVEWASCGETHTDHSVGLSADRPVWEAPTGSPDGMEYFDLLAPSFDVTPTTLDLYQCFTFEIPVDGERHIVRMEPMVDESRVLHHIVVLRDTDHTAPLTPHTCYSMSQGADFLYSWAPGTGAIEFPEGGLAAAPGDRYVIQIHYNNGAGVEGVKDKSGVRFYHAERTGPTYGMIAPGPLVFDVAPGEEKVVEGVCNARQDFTVISGMPHMHEVGTAFDQVLMRDGELVESVIELTGWSFELQYFYSFPMEVKAGDQLVTRCTFNNQTGSRVESGVRTQDEMCFNFMYVTPPPLGRFCDSATAEPFTYSPGACVGPDPIAEPAILDADIVEADPPAFLSGDTPADGRYELVDYALHIPGGVPVGELDEENTFVHTAGQGFVDGDHISVDFGLKFNIALTAGVSFDDETEVSIAGAFAPGEEAGTATLTSDCGAPDGSVLHFWYQAEGDTLRVMLQGDQGPVRTYSVLTFERR